VRKDLLLPAVPRYEYCSNEDRFTVMKKAEVRKEIPNIIIMFMRKIIILGFKFKLHCDRRSVDQFALVSGSPLGLTTRFYPYLFFSDNFFVVVPVGRRL
jgi:hypothetical protein